MRDDHKISAFAHLDTASRSFAEVLKSCIDRVGTDHVNQGYPLLRGQQPGWIVDIGDLFNPVIFRKETASIAILPLHNSISASNDLLTVYRSPLPPIHLFAAGYL